MVLLPYQLHIYQTYSIFHIQINQTMQLSKLHSFTNHTERISTLVFPKDSIYLELLTHRSSDSPEPGSIQVCRPAAASVPRLELKARARIHQPPKYYG
ncbi:hypothetical protein DPMN_093464 [Dreissena polymorpha]|uniref:Uncharacterized protein n=1 Tax=Dreissena polymorpha TaxID=45954 RepID=A0A9D4L3D2_DREPO|nr:hypothetical protein DPMN_093464 [Dreissena polymorpha]